jgi:ABC-type antimicrobial peptide transport system permease subunit
MSILLLGWVTNDLQRILPTAALLGVSQRRTDGSVVVVALSHASLDVCTQTCALGTFRTTNVNISSFDGMINWLNAVQSVGGHNWADDWLDSARWRQTVTQPVVPQTYLHQILSTPLNTPALNVKVQSASRHVSGLQTEKQLSNVLKHRTI